MFRFSLEIIYFFLNIFNDKNGKISSSISAKTTVFSLDFTITRTYVQLNDDVYLNIFAIKHIAK